MPFSNRHACKASVSSLAIIFAASYFDPAFAACTNPGTNQTCTNTGAMTGGTHGIQDSANLTLTNDGGTISGINDGLWVDGNLSLTNTNNGVISSTGAGITNGIYVQGSITSFANSFGSSITGIESAIRVMGGIPSTANFFNAGTISGGHFSGIDAVGFMDVINTGLISGGTYGITGGSMNVSNSGAAANINGTTDSGIFSLTGSTQVSNNGGLISGGRHGVRSEDGDLTVLNGGGGTIQGASVAGIYMRTTTASTYTGSITNQANSTISGKSGIQYDTSPGAMNLSIDNSGSITGTDPSRAAVMVFTLGGSTAINNTATGTITGPGAAILQDGAPLTVDNAGTISNAGFSTTSTAAVNANRNLTVNNKSGGLIASDNDKTAILAQGGHDAVINNSGTISLLSGGFGTTVAYTDMNGTGTGKFTLTNNAGGTIASTGIGIYLYTLGSSSAKIVNVGNIVTANSAIMAYSPLTLQNSGNITSSGASPTVLVSVNNSSITNSGTIANGTGSPAIQYTGGTTGHALNILSGAVFTGGIDWQANIGNTINYGAGNYTTPVLKYLTGSNTINLNNAYQTLITSGLDASGTGNIVVTSATSIPSTAATTSSVSSILASMLDIPDQPLDGFSNNRLDRTVSPAGKPVQALGYGEEKKKPAAFRTFGDGVASDSHGNLVWLRGYYGNHFQTGANGPGAFSYRFGGVAGFDHRFDDRLALGGFFGVGSASGFILDGSGNAKDDLVFGGVYGRKELGQWQFDASMALGGIFGRSNRFVTGVAGPETATGTYRGLFFAPEATFGYRMDLSDDMTVTPFVKLRYNVTNTGAYTETGSSQNLSYGARTTQQFEERAGVKFNRTIRDDSGLATSFNLTGALVASQLVGPSSFAVSFNGTSVNGRYVGRSSQLGGAISTGIDRQLTNNMAVFTSVDGEFYTDGSKTFAARAGLKVKF